MGILDSRNPLAMIIVGLLAIFTLVFLFTTLVSTNQMKELSKLQSNQVKWDFLSINHFSYEAVHGCMFIARHHIEERNGELSINGLNHTHPKRKPYLIEDLFLVAEKAIQQSYQYKISYHPDYGFPISINADWQEHASDDECFYLIEEFKVLESSRT